MVCRVFQQTAIFPYRFYQDDDTAQKSQIYAGIDE
jgi:hypothetical protein